MAHPLSTKLQGFPLFRDHAVLWEPALGEMSLKRCGKDDVLASHGAAANTIWVVISGWVMLARHTPDGREVTVGLCSAGDIFGEAGLFPHANYPYTAQVLQADTELLQMPASLVRRMVQEHPELSQHIMKDLGNRLASSHLKLEQMSSLTATQRLGCFLLRLCQNQADNLPNLSIPVEKHVIASYLGMKPETLSRSIQQLAQVGVQVKGSKAEVKDIARLRSFVCDSCGESGMCATEEATT